VFGDLEVSTITELPLGRAEVATTVVDQALKPAWVERAWQRVVEEVGAGRQAFIITPRISAAEGQGASVEELYGRLSTGALASCTVGMLHGRLPADEKADVMRRFAAGDIDVLVATTVVEVGVDVPNATMMVVCDAENFGISQLHQLRGRIGRGSHASVCLLLTSAEEGTNARDRLNAVAATRDGFELSEVDLAQRREGDVLGRSQSGGRTSLRLLRVLDHAEDIAIARTLAERVVAQDPGLTDPGIRDYVTQIERLAQGEWQEAT
jgi:ATP-dependent DNA helicase RecG